MAHISKILLVIIYITGFGLGFHKNQDPTRTGLGFF